MSGVTDLPFRRLVREFGAGLVVSEMIASTAMIRQMRESVKESRKMSGDCAAEFPLSVQLAGREPAVMAEAARLNQDRGAAVIDINFGCPAKRVTNKARSEEHTSELQSLMRIPYAVFCLKKKKNRKTPPQ